MSNLSTSLPSPEEALAAALFDHKTGFTVTFQNNAGIQAADLEPQVKKLTKALPRLLRKIETEGKGEYDLWPFSQEEYLSSCLVEDLKKLGIGNILGNKDSQTVGIAQIWPSRFISSWATETVDAIQFSLDQANRNKLWLATSVGKKGILFVWVDQLHPAAKAMVFQTIVEDNLKGLELPPEISEVWVVCRLPDTLFMGLIWIWDGMFWSYSRWSEEEIRARNPDLPAWSNWQKSSKH